LLVVTPRWPPFFNKERRYNMRMRKLKDFFDVKFQIMTVYNNGLKEEDYSYEELELTDECFTDD